MSEKQLRGAGSMFISVGYDRWKYSPVGPEPGCEGFQSLYPSPAAKCRKAHGPSESAAACRTVSPATTRAPVRVRLLGAGPQKGHHPTHPPIRRAGSARPHPRPCPPLLLLLLLRRRRPRCRPRRRLSRLRRRRLDLRLRRPGLAGSRGIADSPATRDPGRNQRPATRAKSATRDPQLLMY